MDINMLKINNFLSPAKGVVRVNRSESSNLSFSAKKPLIFQGFFRFYATVMPQFL